MQTFLNIVHIIVAIGLLWNIYENHKLRKEIENKRSGGERSETGFLRDEVEAEQRLKK